jgi:hypothetical protein
MRFVQIRSRAAKTFVFQKKNSSRTDFCMICCRQFVDQEKIDWISVIFEDEEDIVIAHDKCISPKIKVSGKFPSKS